MRLSFGFGGSLVSHGVRNYADVISVIKYGEYLGFDFVQITDRVRDPYVTAAACAEETSRIDMWIGVTNPFTRHPVLVANSLSLLDEIAPGRVAVILGTGNITEMLPQLGYNFSSASERVREAIMIIRQAFKSEDLTFTGKYFKADGKKLAMVANHDIPIYVAANGPRMLEVGGEHADGVITQYADRELLSKALEHVKIGAERAGRALGDIDLVWEGALYVTDGKEDNSSIEGTLLSHAANCVLFCPPSWIELKGISKQDYSRIKQGYVMGSHLDPKLEEEYVEKLAEEPPIKTIRNLFTVSGGTSDCKDYIEKLATMGISRIFMWVPSANPVEKRALLEKVGQHLIPRFR